MFYDNNAVRLCLGCLFLKPRLINNDKYNLTKEDFECCEYHMRLFQVISWLVKHGAEQIDPIDLYNSSQKYQNIIELFDDNNTKDFVQTMKKLANPNNFDIYYEEIKKNSILRNYEKSGFNIDRFRENVQKFTLKEIVDYYDGLQIAIKKRFYQDKNIDETKAGEGFREIKDFFMEEPLFGASTFSEYINTAARGWLNGQLSIYSISSGGGKTSLGLYNLVKVCSPTVWNYKLKKYVPNPCCQHKAGLFIQYEMNAKYEITPRLVASISGVPTYHILNGKYDEGEEERVNEAIEILKQSNIYIVTMPSFTVGLIENYIRDYVLNKNVGYVVFDYISEQASVSSDIAKSNGVATRSDQVLSTISRKLKDVAVENNVAIMTFTQVNANAGVQDILDAGCIAGSRAVQDKADVGAIIMPLRKKEQEVCDMIMDSQFPDVKIKPNRIAHLYKMRFTSEEQGIKVWFNLNLSTGRVVDFWVTDKFDKPYEITKTKLEYK